MRRNLGKAPLAHAVLMPHPTFVLGLAHHRLRREVRHALVDHGLPWAHYLVLAVVTRVPGLDLGGIANRTGVDRTSVGDIVTALHEDAVIECRRDPIDQRRWRAFAAPGAAERVEAARVAILAAERRALLPLDPRERERLRTLAERSIERTLLWRR